MKPINLRARYPIDTLAVTAKKQFEEAGLTRSHPAHYFYLRRGFVFLLFGTLVSTGLGRFLSTLFLTPISK